MFEKRFQKGFDSWRKSYYHTVAYIVMYMRSKYDDGILSKIAEKEGLNGLYETAMEWANEYELNNRGREMDEKTRMDEVRNFCESKNLLF